MTCARDLALKGYQVTVFEKLPVAGGMLRVSIPAYRLPKDVVQKEVDQICSLGVELKVGQALGKDFTIDSLQQQGFKAIFVALGTHKALQLQIPGEKDFPQVLDCIAFLRDVNLDKKPDYAGKKVVVVGGGNAAIDSARTSLRLGADVVIAYRRTIPEMPANSWEIEEAEEEGVKIQTLVAPVRVIGANGKVTGLEVQKMQLGEPDKSGRRRPVPIEGSNYVLPCDVLIAAISQEPDLAGLEGENLKTNKWQCFEADPATLATSRPGVFAGGDVVTGPSTVVQAIGMGRDGAESIHRYLRGLDLHENRPKLKDRTKFIKDIAEVAASPKAGMPKLPLAERRGNFKETELGFPEQVAVKEAARCLNCGGCCECYFCVDACLAKAIVHDSPYEEQVELQVGAVILAPGAQLYDARVRGELGLGRWPNVVTSIQFERILSASGPSKGAVKRPADGDAPAQGRLDPVRRLARPAQREPVVLVGLLHVRHQAGDHRQGARRADRAEDLLHGDARLRQGLRQVRRAGEERVRREVPARDGLGDPRGARDRQPGAAPRARGREARRRDLRHGRALGRLPAAPGRGAVRGDLRHRGERLPLREDLGLRAGRDHPPRHLRHRHLPGAEGHPRHGDAGQRGGRRGDGAARRGARDRGRQEGAAAGDGRRGPGAADRRLRLPLRHEHLVRRSRSTTWSRRSRTSPASRSSRTPSTPAPRTARSR